MPQPAVRMVARLKALTTVTDLIGSGDEARIYPIQRYQGDVLPAITYQRLGNTPLNHSTGETETAWATVQVLSIAIDEDAAWALAAAVKGDGEAGAATGLSAWTDDTGTPVIGMCHWQGDNELPDSNIPGQSSQVYVVQSEYFIGYQQRPS